MPTASERTVLGKRVIDVEDDRAGIGFSVSPQTGGELSSLRVKRAGGTVELLHRANTFRPLLTRWRGRAPWLFPAVGRSAVDGRMGFYRLGGQEYAMPIHGFVRDREWEASAGKDGVVRCRTPSDEETRKLYPFDFELSASFAVQEGRLRVAAEVAAAPSNDQAMPFSIGSHITLAIPLVPGSDAGACSVRCPARRRLLLSTQGLLTGESAPGRYAQPASLREDGALCDMVLGDLPEGQAWAELLDPSGFGVRVSQQAPHGLPEEFRFVFYSDGRSFFCPEPWYGSPNSLNSGAGLLVLAPGARAGWSIDVEILGR